MYGILKYFEKNVTWALFDVEKILHNALGQKKAEII